MEAALCTHLQTELIKYRNMCRCNISAENFSHRLFHPHSLCHVNAPISVHSIQQEWILHNAPHYLKDRGWKNLIYQVLIFRYTCFSNSGIGRQTCESAANNIAAFVRRFIQVNLLSNINNSGDKNGSFGWKFPTMHKTSNFSLESVPLCSSRAVFHSFIVSVILWKHNYTEQWSPSMHKHAVCVIKAQLCETNMGCNLLWNTSRANSSADGRLVKRQTFGRN